MKKSVVVGSIVTLFALVIFNIVLTIYGLDTGVTGNVVKEPVETVEIVSQRVLLKELEETNDDLREENQNLKNKVLELENEIQELIEIEEIKEESCNLQCEEDELCQGINKADGSVKFTCIKDPNKLLGAEANR